MQGRGGKRKENRMEVEEVAKAIFQQQYEYSLIQF